MNYGDYEENCAPGENLLSIWHDVLFNADLVFFFLNVSFFFNKVIKQVILHFSFLLNEVFCHIDSL
jgi:hypothetical protein